MKNLVYNKSEKRFYSIPKISKEEYEKDLAQSMKDAKEGNYAVVLDSPESIAAFKSKYRR